MVKKLLFFIIISFFSVVTYGQQIDLSTISSSDAWSPERVDKDAAYCAGKLQELVCRPARW